MKRGDVVVVALPGDVGKPRPSVIVQTDRLNDTYDTVIVCPFSSQVDHASIGRIRVEPRSENGLEKPSIIMMEKIQSVRRSRISRVIGRLDRQTLERMDDSLAIVLGLV